jgi:hypothetical protein
MDSQYWSGTLRPRDNLSKGRIVQEKTLGPFGSGRIIIASRVSFETSFDSKQPKLEPKLVSALSETKRLFRLFRFYTETASFGVSIEPKQTEDQPKQTEMKAMWRQQ